MSPIDEETEPDWAMLRAACKELEQLEARGNVTGEEWDHVYELAIEAVGTHTEFLEGILMQGRALGLVTSTVR